MNSKMSLIPAAGVVVVVGAALALYVTQSADPVAEITPSAPVAKAAPRPPPVAAAGAKKAVAPTPSAAETAAAAAAGASAPPAAAPPMLKAVRQIPRKKYPLVPLDLNGDGKLEQLLLKQRQPSTNWQGKDKEKGPNFVLEIRTTGADGKPAKLLGSKPIYGWGQGWSQIGVRTGADTHIGIAYWSVPEEHAPRATYVWMSDGKVHWGRFKRLPLELIDLRFSQQEAVLTLSQELYHDYLKRGTTDLLQWQGGRFESILEKPVFELCVAAVREPHVYFAAVPQAKKSVLLLRASEDMSLPMNSVWQTTVSPPSEGPRYTVPTGFALSCDREKGRVQYKSSRFTFADGALKPIADAPLLGAAGDSTR